MYAMIHILFPVSLEREGGGGEAKSPLEEGFAGSFLRLMEERRRLFIYSEQY